MKHTRQKTLMAWLIGALSATLLFILLSQITYFRFENSDDALVVKGFMGFEGGSPIGFSYSTHTWLTQALRGLSLLFPQLAWFSIFQFALLWFSQTVLVKSIVQCTQRGGAPLWVGALWGLIFLGVYTVFAICRLSFTTTAAVASAAAIAQLLSIDHSRSSNAQILAGMALCAALMTGAYLLRSDSALLVFAFGFLASCLILCRDYGLGKRQKRNPKMYIACLLALLGLLGILWGVRQWETHTPALRDDTPWHAARVRLYDYTPFESNPAPALAAQTDLSKEQIELLREWYLMDSDFTTESLQALAQAYPPASFGERVQSGLAQMISFLNENTRYLTATALLVFVGLLCVLRRQKEDSLAAPLVCLSTLALLIAALFYLAYQGRFLSRGVDAAFFPAAAMIFCLSANMPYHRKSIQPRAKRIAIAAVCMVCCALALTNFVLTKRVLSDTPDSISQQREADLEAYALQNPDQLILRTPNLLRDTRLFPDVSAGIPGNIMIWGDWTCRTPSWYAQLEQFVPDARGFSAIDWLNPALVFATADEQPPQALTTYISQGADAPVSAELCGTYGSLRFFRFHTNPTP